MKHEARALPGQTNTPSSVRQGERQTFDAAHILPQAQL